MTQRARATPPLGRLYDVDGRQLLLHRSGSGGPAVVFFPGAGMTGLGYWNVHEQISQFTTSVLYDRAGTGWSDSVPLPRSATEVTDEARQLLSVAGVAGPLLLVGHSLGGIYARRYAQRFPDEVAAILMLDSAHEDLDAQMPKATLGEKLRMTVGGIRVLLQFERSYRGLFERMYAQWPEAVRLPLVEYHLHSWRTGMHETKNVSELYDEVHRGPAIPDVPLIALCTMGNDRFRAVFTPESYIRRVNQCVCEINRTIAASVPQGEHRVLADAGHATIHVDRPDAVVQAVRELVDKVNQTRS